MLSNINSTWTSPQGPRRLALICAALFLVVTPADAQVGAPLPVDKLQPPDFVLDSPQGLDRGYYFGGDNHTLPGELERYIDPTYCDAADPGRARRVSPHRVRAVCVGPPHHPAHLLGRLWLLGNVGQPSGRHADLAGVLAAADRQDGDK
jgi:hypothetical protein